MKRSIRESTLYTPRYKGRAAARYPMEGANNG